MTEIRIRTGQSAELIHIIGGSAKTIPAADLAGFVHAASDCGAEGISLYAFPQTHPRDWTVLATADLNGIPIDACQR